MTTFAISTLGCKVNTYESQGYESALVAKGYKEVSFKEKADIYIINTCSVTNTAASKSRQRIRQAIALQPNALIVVVGCYVQTSSEQVEAMEHVDIMIGSDGKDQLSDRIQEALLGKRKQKVIHEERAFRVFETLPIQKFEHQTRAFLKIQDGCNQFCSFCIIPNARGIERYESEETILHIAKQLVQNGHKEIVLTGIHIGRYGHGSTRTLCDVLKRMVKEVTKLERIRISSIEMNEVTDELLLFMKEESKIARHLHIPIQSANDKVLQDMNRPYDVATFATRISYIQTLLPDISISSDVIVGFPQESEAEFMDTMNNIKRMKLSFLHVFPYSKRDNTRAAHMRGHIENERKKQRAAKMAQVSQELYRTYKEMFVGRVLSVLFEKEKDGMLIGHSSEYLEVQSPVVPNALQTIRDVSITSCKEGMLEGVIL